MIKTPVPSLCPLMVPVEWSLGKQPTVLSGMIRTIKPRGARSPALSVRPASAALGRSQRRDAPRPCRRPERPGRPGRKLRCRRGKGHRLPESNLRCRNMKVPSRTTRCPTVPPPHSFNHPEIITGLLNFVKILNYRQLHYTCSNTTFSFCVIHSWYMEYLIL